MTSAKKDSVATCFSPAAVGAFIKNLRERRGLSQVDLASTIGMAQQAISTIERGTGVPSITSIELISGALDVDVFSVLKVGFGLSAGTDLAAFEDLRALFFQLSPQSQALAIEQLQVLVRWDKKTPPRHPGPKRSTHNQ